MLNCEEDTKELLKSRSRPLHTIFLWKTVVARQSRQQPMLLSLYDFYQQEVDMSKISNTRTQTGTLLRCLTILLAASSVLAICTKAQAGSFTTTYSSGAATPSYALQTNGVYGPNGAELGEINEPASLSSAITVNFTWVPNPAFPNNDPKPTTVII
jgi:hypothetical protein